MGALHKALEPELEKWAENHDGRQLMMVCPVGSFNYDCVIQNSDLDMKAVYMPSLRDLFLDDNPKFALTSEQFDCELHPAQHYLQHALKGNLNFFEPLFARRRRIHPGFAAIVDGPLKRMVKMNVKSTVMGSHRFALQQRDKASARKETWGKSASHAIRILVFLINLIESGEWELVPRPEFKTLILNLKQGRASYEEYFEIFTQLETVAATLAFTDPEKRKFTDVVMDMDRTETTLWTTLEEEVYQRAMSIIREGM